MPGIYTSIYGLFRLDKARCTTQSRRSYRLFPLPVRFRGSARTGHAAKARLRLECAGQAVALSQIAPDWVIPAEPCDLAAGPGELVIEVDDREHRQPVFLPEGMSHASARVAIETRAGVG